MIEGLLHLKTSSLIHHRLWWIVAILWGLWAVRAHNILAMPIFVDESLHMIRAQLVFEFTDAKASFLLAKLLLYYYLGLFAPQDVGGAWVSRQAIALLVPLSAALSYRLAVMLFKRPNIGFITIGLGSLLPFYIFFERMALADPFALVFCIIVAILAYRLALKPSYRFAYLTGLALGFAMLAKLTSAPLIALPPLAAYLFGRWHWRQYWQYGWRVGLITFLCLLPSLSYMAYQELNPPESKVEAVEQDLFTPANRGRLEQIAHNIDKYVEASRAMFTDPLLILILFAILWQSFRTPRITLYLLAFTLLIWLPITLTSARPSTRYLVNGVPGVLIIGAAALYDWWQLLQFSQQYMRNLGRVVLAIATILLLVWASRSLNFIYDAWQNPEQLALAERDIWEYYQNTAAGYPLQEVAIDVQELPPLIDHPSGHPIPIAGFVGSCHAMRWYLPAHSGVLLECPYWRWSPERADAILQAWEDRVKADQVWYFLADAEQPMDVYSLDLNFETIKVYERPHNGIPVTLMRVTSK
ncbi:MAG: hypothetical protein CUN55_03030 [Phototrophicales bacterium]|nr:MAG: hypothetical protein CUN55_03030 [Phototrophicales bacterium]